MNNNDMKTKNKNNNNKTQKNNKNDNNTMKLLTENMIDVTDNPYLIIGIFLIAVGFIIYTLYYYYTSKSGLYPAKTYYGIDWHASKPIFDVPYENIKDCIDKCELDPLCSGITYDDEEQKCIGIKDGKLRDDTSNFTSWLKTKRKMDKNLLKTILIGNTVDPIIISKDELSSPKIVGEFGYAFWLNINSWYNDFKYWKHIWHKGDEIDNTINYTNWDDLIHTFSNQSPGIWLSPYTNNLRICFTVKLNKFKSKNNKYIHANTQICLDDRNIDVRQSNKCPENCFISNSKQSESFQQLNSFNLTNGICTDNNGNNTNYTEYNITADECKEKCINDELCQGFSQKNNGYFCKLYGIDKEQNGTDMKSIITSGNIDVPGGENYKCYTKLSYQDPFNKQDKKMEYIDIKNIPINEPFFIGLSFKKNILELYFNGKLKETKQIDGEIDFGSGNVYAKYNKTFDGNLYQLAYSPININYNMMKKLYDEKPKLEVK